MTTDQLEGRNVTLEALRRRRRRVLRVWLDDRAKQKGKIAELLHKAARDNIPVRRVPRHQLDRMSQSRVHNGVIAEAEPLPAFSTHGLLADLDRREEAPFLVLLDEVSYEHNLGAVMRSALGAGVHGVIVPVRRGKGLTAVVQRVAMGGAEEVPLIREGLSSSLAQIRRAGIPVIGAAAGGTPPWELNLTGPVAFVLGGEDKGLTSTLRRKCDAVAGIPLRGNLSSLNVSVAAAVLMFEKVRQDAGRHTGAPELPDRAPAPVG